MPSWLSRLFRNSTDVQVQPSRRLPRGAYRNAVTLQQGDGAPEWIRVVPIGTFPTHHDGPHEITAEHIQEMAASFERTSTDVLVDVEHGSLCGESRAAGWSDAVESRADGLYMRYPEWTPYGQTYVDAREYRYLSPVYQVASVGKDGSDRGAQLLSVALTNSPYLNEGEIDPIRNTNPAGTAPDQSPDTPTTMNEKIRARLIKKFGLTDDATDEQIEAAIEKEEQEADAAAAQAQKAEADAKAKEAEEATANETLQQKVDRLEKEMQERDAAEADERADVLVNSAVQRGAILPAQKAIYLNSARHDFEATKQELDALVDGAALPGRVRVNSAPASGARTNSRRSTLTAPTSAMDYVNQQIGG